MSGLSTTPWPASGRDAAHVVVVGSGAGGSAAARELARAGLDVLVLEMGEPAPPSSFTQREDEMIPRLFQNAGGRTTTDGAITVLQGKGLGGSTLHNLNLCKRVPDALLDRWTEQQRLGDLAERLTASYAVMEQDLGVVRIADSQVNRHNALFAQGCRALGLAHGRLFHNRRGCVGSGFCELGCAYDAKMNAARVLLPEAVRHGARLRTGVRVTAIRHRGRRATGVDGVVTEGGRPRRVRVDARAVVLAASATGTPALLLASGLGDRHRRTGRGLHLHPAAAVGAVFDQPVEAWHGIPQSVECTAFLDPVDPARRVWLVPVFAHPVGAALMVPGFGPDAMTLLRQYRYLAAASPMLHDATAGHVSATRHGRPRIHYRLCDSDRAALANGIADAARIWLAAGARRAIIPWAQPVRLSSLAEADAIRSRLPRRLDPPLVAVHPMGGMAMAGDPRLGPVDPYGRHHEVAGLYVADGSLFPSSTGVPPQITIYSLGRLVGQTVAAELG